MCGGSCRDHGDAFHGFSVQGWFLLFWPGSYYPGRAHDSVTVTVVSEDFMRDSYPYADVLVPTSGLSIHLFPIIVI